MYLIFAGKYYYPNGGFRDFVAVRDTHDEAKEFLKYINGYDWAEIAHIGHNELSSEYYTKEDDGWHPNDKYDTYHESI